MSLVTGGEEFPFFIYVCDFAAYCYRLNLALLSFSEVPSNDLNLKTVVCCG